MKTAMCLKEYVRTSRLAGGGVSDGHCVELIIILEYLYLCLCVCRAPSQMV